jgi:molybdenum-pterin binding domain
MKGNPVRISARNQFKGTVISIEQGAVNGIVQIELAPGLVISSSITNEAIQELGLTVGEEAVAVVKASSVMVGVQD